MMSTVKSLSDISNLQEEMQDLTLPVPGVEVFTSLLSTEKSSAGLAWTAMVLTTMMGKAT